MKNLKINHRLIFLYVAFPMLIGGCNPSARKLILHTEQINISFDNKDGIPVSYDLIGSKETVKGKPDHTTGLDIVMRHKTTRQDTLLTANFVNIDFSENAAFANYCASVDGRKTIQFTLKYEIDDLSVKLTLDKVVEDDPYLLIEVRNNSLITFTDETGKEWLAHGDAVGFYSTVKDAKTCVLPDGCSKDFVDFPNFTYLPLVMMGNTKVNCSMETEGYLCNTALSVCEEENKKYASMGVRGYYRVRGGEKTPDLLVEQKEFCRIDFTRDYDNNGTTDWLDASKAVRDRMPEIPTHYFDDRFVWIISGQHGRAPKENITFRNIIQVIKKICYLTDKCPQEVYISGWTEGGHDTAYPNVTVLNKKMGGREGYFKLKEEALKYATNVSFDDMYDDHYENEYSNGFYNEKNIARAKDGSLMTFRAWNDTDTCRIAGMAKYMEDGGDGMKRIEYMIDNYQLKKSLLIDGLSWWSIRHDWDIEKPTSAVKNLRDGKFKIIEQYRHHDISIVSELLRYPYIGKLAYVVDGPQDSGWSWNGFGGDIVPVMRIVYSRSMIYGGNGGDGLFRDPREVLFNNNRRGPWISEETKPEEITDYYYLNFLPWKELHALDVKSYSKAGDIVNIELEDHWTIHLDYSRADGYKVTHHGAPILDGPSLSLPVDHNKIVFYSKNPKTITYDLPENIDISSCKARRLTPSGPEKHVFKLIEGKLEMNIPANIPVIFYLNKDDET